jgi:hypothetical protein
MSGKKKTSNDKKGTVLFLCTTDDTEFRGTTWARGDLLALPASEIAPNGFRVIKETAISMFVVDLAEDGTPALFLDGKKTEGKRLPIDWSYARIPVEVIHQKESGLEAVLGKPETRAKNHDKEPKRYAYQDHLFKIGPALSRKRDFILALSEGAEVGGRFDAETLNTVELVTVFGDYQKQGGDPGGFFAWLQNTVHSHLAAIPAASAVNPAIRTRPINSSWKAERKQYLDFLTTRHRNNVPISRKAGGPAAFVWGVLKIKKSDPRSCKLVKTLQKVWAEFRKEHDLPRM